MKSPLLLTLLVLSLQLSGQDHQAYIERYIDIAVSEMYRTGIPASIKLAQAILESSGGKSTLARNAHNHFGIKCGSEWRGKKTYRKDDDRNDHGRLIASCFRVFESGQASFIAHSEFLRDPGKSFRYGFLFDLARDDYRGWARGLKKAGYATNPRYPHLLIKLIEDYALYEYDKVPLEAVLASAPSDEWANEKHRQADRSVSVARKTYAEFYNNNLRYVKAYEGDQLQDIAHSSGVPVWRLMRYNEYIADPHQRLERGSKVYLQRKRNKFKGDQKFHVVANDETIDEIAHHYGMLTDALYRRNNLPAGSQPAIGEILVLRGKNKKTVALRSEQSPVIERLTPTSQPGIFLDEITAPADEPQNIDTRQDTSAPDEGIASTASTPSASVTEGLLPESGYIVQQSDTLYQIARLHGLTVSDLKKINNLHGDTIHPGQVLKVAE